MACIGKLETDKKGARIVHFDRYYRNRSAWAADYRPAMVECLSCGKPHEVTSTCPGCGALSGELRRAA